jgi:hypothetical protein
MESSSLKKMKPKAMPGMSVYPAELVSTGLLVGVLPVQSSAVDSCLERLVSSLIEADDRGAGANRGAEMRFVGLKAGHSFPSPKRWRGQTGWMSEDGTSMVESEVPRGILKSGWIRKHILELPSVVLMVAGLDLSESPDSFREQADSLEVEVRRVVGQLQALDVQLLLAVWQHGSSRALGVDNSDMVDQRVADLRRRGMGCSTFAVGQGDLGPGSSAAKTLANRLREAALGHTISSLQRLRRKEQLLAPVSTRYRHLMARLRIKTGIYLESTGNIEQSSQCFRESLDILAEVIASQRLAGRSFETQASGALTSACDMCWQARAVAEFVHLRLMKRIKSVPEAVLHFQTYMARFGGSVWVAEPVYKYHAWVCQQHVAFAEILADFKSRSGVNSGDPVVEDEACDPAYYWCNAALHSMMRLATVRREGLKDFSNLEQAAQHAQAPPPAAPPGYVWHPPLFLGEDVTLVEQQQCREHLHGDALWAAQKRCMDSMEARVDQLAICDHLLSIALGKIKPSRPRKRVSLIAHMAEVSSLRGDDGPALQFWSQALEYYAVEGWSELAAPALLGIAKCAQRVGNTGDAMSALLKLASLDAPLARREACLDEAFGLVDDMTPGSAVVEVDFGPSVRGAIRRPLRISGRFDAPSASAGGIIYFTLSILSSLPRKVTPGTLSLEFSHPAMQVVLVHEAHVEEPRALNDGSSGAQHRFAVDLSLLMGNLQKVVLPLVLRVSRTPDSPPLCLVRGRLAFMKGSLLISVRATQEPDLFSLPEEVLGQRWSESCGYESVVVAPPVARAHLSVKEAHVPLRDALNKLDIIIRGNGDRIEDGELFAECLSFSATPTKSTHLPPAAASQPLLWIAADPDGTVFEPLPPMQDASEDRSSFGPLTVPIIEGEDGMACMSIWVRGMCRQEGDAAATLSFRLRYSAADKVGSSESTRSHVGNTVQVIPQTVLKAEVQALQATDTSPPEALDSVDESSVPPLTICAGSPALVRVTLISPQDQLLQLLRVEVVPPDSNTGVVLLQDTVLFEDSSSENGVPNLLEGAGVPMGRSSTAGQRPMTLSRDGSFVVGFRIIGEAPGLYSLGNILIHWCRAADASSIATQPPEPTQLTMAAISELQLPLVRVTDLPLAAVARLPNAAKQGAEFGLCWELTNLTPLHQDVKLTASGGSDFAWSGSTECLIQLAPHETSSISYTLVPLSSGHLSLPCFSMIWKRSGIDILAEVGSRAIFVRPG